MENWWMLELEAWCTVIANCYFTENAEEVQQWAYVLLQSTCVRPRWGVRTGLLHQQRWVIIRLTQIGKAVFQVKICMFRLTGDFIVNVYATHPGCVQSRWDNERMNVWSCWQLSFLIRAIGQMRLSVVTWSCVSFLIRQISEITLIKGWENYTHKMRHTGLN